MLSGGIALGTGIPQLDLTENSSTSLTANLTGTTVTVSVASTPTPDQWVLTFSASVTGQEDWLEPGNPNSSNLILPIAGFPDQLLVTSDTTASPGALANNTTTSDAPPVFDLGGGVLDVNFNDLGDGPSVPDATSTLPLLSLSLAGLGFLARRLKV